MKEPKFRFGTRQAIDSLALELSLPNEKGMQDWSYEVAKYEDIQKYINHYESLNDEDKKFVLMEIIIQSTEEQLNNENFIKYLDKIKPLLMNDFDIHEYTIYYWSCFDKKNIDDCWRITPFIRQLWNTKL